MASLSVISWRDIPAQVVVRRGRETAKAKLSDRFQEAVDRAAMRAGKGSSDLYLAEWKRSRRHALQRRHRARGRRGSRAASRRATRTRISSGWSARKASTNQRHPHDRHRRQFRHPRSRHRLRSPVRDHRRAHQSDRAQAPRRRNGRRRLQPRRVRRARAGGSRRAHAGRQRRDPARRRAGDPREGHPARAVDHRPAAVDRFLHRRRARGRASRSTRARRS